MRFLETPLRGAFVINPEPVADERGYFARIWCRDELAAHGLDTGLAQASVSHNQRKGTLRGLHYQIAPHEEAKVVSCIRGAIHDVIVDLRSSSLTYCHHFALRLDAEGHRSLYVPRGFAHGFQTLEDDTVVQYLISERHHPESARGVRWDDPTLRITWPLPVTTVSARDLAFLDLQPQR